MKNTFTPEQKKAYFADRRIKYLQALKDFKDKLAKDYICYNAFTGRIYSGNNHCFLAAQGGDAGAYAGFNQWRSKGYQVKKGSHGVVVVQPIVKNKENAKGEKESEMVCVSYVSIFHFSQVEPARENSEPVKEAGEPVAAVEEVKEEIPALAF